MSWAVAQGILTGSANGTVIMLNPTGSATRAELATVLMRYQERWIRIRWGAEFLTWCMAGPVATCSFCDRPVLTCAGAKAPWGFITCHRKQWSPSASERAPRGAGREG